MSDRIDSSKDWPDDDAARRLRDALAQEARSVPISGDGLAIIRERIAAQRHSRRAWLRPLAMVAAAAATATVAVVAVVGLQPHHTNAKQPALGSGSSSTPTPSASPSTPVVTSSAPAAPTYTIPVYYVGIRKDPQPLLYQEMVTRPKPAGNAFIRDAVTAMLTTQPADPDYTSYWPSGTTVVGASIQNDTEAIIDLSPDATNAVPAASGMTAISLQQLFYTVHVAAPKIQSLELRIGGTPVTSLWGTPVTEPVVVEPAWQVFSHVWITSPTEHATVPTTFTIKGEATVFEGTVNWEIAAGNGGQVLQRGATQTAATSSQATTPTPGLWEVTVTLAPGDYVLRAYETSAKDGSVTYLDDKAVTVQ
jgi:hypothetical protein